MLTAGICLQKQKPKIPRMGRFHNISVEMLINKMLLYPTAIRTQCSQDIMLSGHNALRGHLGKRMHVSLGHTKG